MCRRCGLVLTPKRVKDGTRLSYDVRDWKRLCKLVALDSVLLCLFENGGSGAGEPSVPLRQ